MPSNWLLFDRIRALTKTYRIYQGERAFQDQSQLDRVTAGGEFLDWNQQAAILDQTNLQINRLERYKDYEQMDQTGEVSLALDLYADEASLVDPERKHTLVIRARNRRLKRELEDLFFNVLQWDTYCRPSIRYLCKYGDFPAEIIPDANRTGVSSLRFMNVYNFTRIETRFGDLVGFFYQDAMYPHPIFLHPWQVMHLRLTDFGNIYHPYGRAMLDGGRKAFKQLRLMEDAALIYRITRAPEKRKFKIPVGQISPKEVPEYMQMLARIMKRQRFYNPTTGTFDERYSPLIQEDDFFLPMRPDGQGPDIDTMPGAENLDQIADIEYFKKKMISPMKIPFARVGIGDGAGEATEKSLSQSHSEFAKSVQWVQREVAKGLTKVAIVHLALRGYSVEDLRGFEIALTATSAMEDLYRIETWQTRASVMAELKDLNWFPKEWIVTHFTDLSPDEIEELRDLETKATGGGGGGGGGPGGAGVLDAPEIPGADGGLLAGDEGGAGEGGGPPGEETEASAAPPGGPPGKKPLGAEARAARDYDRLITEMADIEESTRRKAVLRKMAMRAGKEPFTEGRVINNGFDHWIETKELDGLTRTKPESNDNPLSPFDPNDTPGLLVEWSVSKETRGDVIKEVYQVIADDAPAVNDDGEITTADIPSYSTSSL